VFFSEHRLAHDLVDLPVLSYSDVVELAQRSGLDVDGRHVLPRGTNKVVCRDLDAPGYWVVAPPADTTPYYARSCGAPPRCRRGRIG